MITEDNVLMNYSPSVPKWPHPTLAHPVTELVHQIAGLMVSIDQNCQKTGHIVNPNSKTRT